MIDFFEIQTQMHTSNLRSSQAAISAGVFTCFIDQNHSAHYANFAIPSGPMPDEIDSSIEELIAIFNSQKRKPRLEFIDACAPGLEAALHDHGFTTESHTPLMVCTTQSWRTAQSIPGLELTLLDTDSNLENYQQFITVQKRSFGNDDDPKVSLEEARQYRKRFGDMIKILAILEKQPVGVGTLTYPESGVVEAAGIGTLRQFRQRGIASNVTSRLCQSGFQAGLHLIYLTAADEQVRRIYQRVGFKPTSTYQINISLQK